MKSKANHALTIYAHPFHSSINFTAFAAIPRPGAQFSSLLGKDNKKYKQGKMKTQCLHNCWPSFIFFYVIRLRKHFQTVSVVAEILTIFCLNCQNINKLIGHKSQHIIVKAANNPGAELSSIINNNELINHNLLDLSSSYIID